MLKNAQKVGNPNGLCNAVQITKDLREFIFGRRLRTQMRKVVWSPSTEKSVAITTTRKRSNTVYAYNCEAHEPIKRTQETQNKDHEDHIAQQGFHSWSLGNLVHKPIAQKIPEAKNAVDKEWHKQAWQESQEKGEHRSFAMFMDSCHLKNSDMEKTFPRYRSPVVSRGDVVKDDSGSYAACTEQGSPASHARVATVLDVISRRRTLQSYWDCLNLKAPRFGYFIEITP